MTTAETGTAQSDSPSQPVEAGMITDLTINLNVGNITLTAHDHPGVIGRISGPGAEAFEVVADAHSLTITSPRRERQRHVVFLSIPLGVHATLQVGRGNITSDAALGAVTCQSGSGRVTLTEVATIACTVGSGNIHLGAITGDSAKVGTGSGNVTIGRCDAAVHIRSGSGNITVRELHAAMYGATGSGSFEIDQLHGAADVRSGSGNIDIAVANSLPTWLDLKSGSGQVHVELDDTDEPARDEPHATVRARTGSGRIHISRTRN